MSHARVTVLAPAVALALALALSGCIANMPELKEKLGVEEKVVPQAFVPPPPLEPPVARAQANSTNVLAGAPVKFLSEGTRDPRGLSLTYNWDFGDGRSARSPTALHAYDAAGEYLVKLRVVNAEGLADEDSLTLQVSLGNRAPVAAMRVLDASGEESGPTTCGTKLAFDATASKDPDAQPLAYQWDLGDGSTSLDARVVHAYEKPGLYVAKLVVADPAGARAETSRTVRVGCAWSTSGAFAPTDASSSFTFPVAQGASSVALTLRFPAGMGLNDLQLVVLDAAGTEVQRTDGATQPGAQEDQTRTLTISGAALSPGAWSAQVVKKSGVQATWTLDINELV